MNILNYICSKPHGKFLAARVMVFPLPRVTYASLVAQIVKHLPIVRETWVQSLGREDLLEKEMATHSSILAWKSPWMEEPGGLQSVGSQRVRHDWATSQGHLHLTHWLPSYLHVFTLLLTEMPQTTRTLSLPSFPSWKMLEYFGK